jgi:hypothetical protein
MEKKPSSRFLVHDAVLVLVAALQKAGKVNARPWPRRWRA